MKLSLHVGLFLLTLVTTMLAGVQWLNLDALELGNIARGIPYALAVCAILSAHEAGHYFAARRHGVKTTLPYFLPFPAILIEGLLTFGTLGAVIRIRSHVDSRRTLFDIGVSGPIAGFVASLAVLIAGYATLPSFDYLLAIHPEYARMDHLPAGGLTFGTPLILHVVRGIVPMNHAFIPPMNEVYHYPLLCAGWFGMFLTAMNLLPVGQLDGGHIARALLGKNVQRLEQLVLILLVTLGILGIFDEIGFNLHCGWPGWLFWAAILAFLVRRSRKQEDVNADEIALDNPRRLIAITCALILVFTFSFSPFSFD
jgi:membrane-associated protease RseP (regulator of RpoE activity)